MKRAVATHIEQPGSERGALADLSAPAAPPFEGFRVPRHVEVGSLAEFDYFLAHLDEQAAFRARMHRLIRELRARAGAGEREDAAEVSR